MWQAEDIEVPQDTPKVAELVPASQQPGGGLVVNSWRVELILPPQGSPGSWGSLGVPGASRAELHLEAGGDPWAPAERGLGKASLRGLHQRAGGLLSPGPHTKALPPTGLSLSPDPILGGGLSESA